MSDMPEDVMERYAGVCEYDWAARLIDPKACEAFESGDGFDRLQNARRLMEARHIAATIILAERRKGFNDGFLRGFKSSSEGYNAEYPFEGLDIETDKDWSLGREMAFVAYIRGAT